MEQISFHDIEYLKGKLCQYPDFPEKGIVFEDIMPIFQDPVAFRKLISAFTAHIISCYGTVDVVVGLDARGFLFGPALALQLNAAFVPVRKAGKLPGKCVTVEYMKEYGKDLFAMQQHAIEPRQRVIIVDDIIATGGSAEAAGKLVSQLGGIILEYLFMLELDFLRGRDKLNAPVFTLLKSQTG